MSRLRVLIADDELLARKRLQDLLEDEEDVEVVAAVTDGRAAAKAIRELEPDLVFLDVQMPGLTGVEVVDDVGPERMPVTIFVTAYDQYLLRAFEVAALDYLLKPFDDERFEQAFARARRMIELEEVGRTTRKLLSLLGRSTGGGSQPEEPGETPAPGYLERLAVEMRGQVRVVPVDTIDYIEASGPYAEIHVGDKTYVIRERMQTLADRLDPSRFFRIHRSAIVRIDRIEVLLRSSGGDYAVRLKGGTELSVSRSRREELEEKLGMMR